MKQDRNSKEPPILLIHPCEVVKQGICLLLEKNGYKVIVAKGATESELKTLNDLQADIILIHYSQFRSGGLIEQLIDRTGAKVILLASSDSYHQDSYQHMLEQITEGVTGFLDMDQPVQKFLSELESITSGDIVVSDNFVKNLKECITDSKEKLDEALSEREAEVLNLVGTGSTNKEIGEELFISENTVKVHLRSVLTKLNLRNRQQAVAYIVRKGLMAKQDTGTRS